MSMLMGVNAWDKGGWDISVGMVDWEGRIEENFGDFKESDRKNFSRKLKDFD